MTINKNRKVDSEEAKCMDDIDAIQWVISENFKEIRGHIGKINDMAKNHSR